MLGRHGFGNWFGGIGRDLRLALRSLRRAPGFAAAVITTIALCLGPNVAIVTLLYALALKPQPFLQPERLVQVMNAFGNVPGGPSKQSSSQPQYRDFQAQADLFQGFAMMQYFGTTIGEETTPERGTGMRVDAGFFPLLGLRPVVGRFATAEEDAVGRDRVLVLTETFWRTRYGADPHVVGRSVRMGGEPWTIIGVAPRSVEGLDPNTMFFKPFERVAAEELPNARYRARTIVYGRLKAGVSLEGAQAQLAEIEKRYIAGRASAPERTQLESRGHRIVLERLGEAQAAAVRSPLALLEGGALFVLLIGVINVLNLLLARMNAKRSELSIRVALGAGRGELLRQLLAETMMLAMVAGVLGLALAWGSLQVINRYLHLVAAKTMPVSLDLPVIGAILLSTIFLALVLGAVQFAVFWNSRFSPADSRSASSSSSSRAFGSALVITQVAVAIVLLVGAGLLVRSFVRVLAVDLGFDAAHVVQGRVAVPKAYETPAQNVAFQRRIMEAFQGIPGVRNVSRVSDYAIGTFRTIPFTLHGNASAPGGSQPIAYLNWVSPGYFDTMSMRMLDGRSFAENDDWRKGLVVVVDDLFAKRYFPGRSAVGEEISLGTELPPAGTPWPRIVGVVQRAQLAGPEARDRMPFIYGPIVHQPAPGFTFVVSSPRPSSDVLAAMRQKLREIDSTIPLYWTASLQEGIDGMLQVRRGLLLLIAAFATLALLLAGVGLYGVLAYDVSRRTREIGIRAAIGATRAQVVAMVLYQALWKTVIGLLVGLAIGAYLTRFLGAMLFETGRFDPLTFLAVPLLMVAVAAVAAWLPARRAAKVDPIVALRAE